MEKYGFDFGPDPSLSGWFTANGVTSEAALVAANRIHSTYNIGSDVVFCGRGPNDDTDRLYLIDSGDPVKVAQDFAVGSHAAMYDEDVVAETRQMLTAVFAVAPFTPILANPAAYEARFTGRIDKALAGRVLAVIERHDAQGVDYYASRFPDFTDEDVVRSLVEEQRLHLWWD